MNYYNQTMKRLCCLLVLTIAVVTVNAGYCGLPSCHGRPHTLCTYFSLYPSAQCSQHNSAGLSSAEKNEILHLHNSLRSRVANGRERRGRPGPQPAATNIRPLQWDNELAMIAQRWANQCNYGHDSCRDVERFKVGQNVAYKANTGGYFGRMTDMVWMWYNEVKDFDHRLVSRYQFSPKTGHYTQMMWAGTRTIGCGAVKYKKNNYWYTMYLVCNYGPTGNYIGQRVYNPR